MSAPVGVVIGQSAAPALDDGHTGHAALSAGRPTLVIFGVRPLVFYRIGWRLDQAGAVTGGWTESIPAPWPGQVGGPPVVEVGVAVADVDNDLQPELAVKLMTRPAAGPEAH